MTFWIISGAMALATALLIGWALLRPRVAQAQTLEQMDLRIYTDQLQAVEKDLERGVVTAEEADRLRTEIKRRILDADKAHARTTDRAPRTLSFGAAAVAGMVVIGGAFLLYEQIGAPGYADQPIKKRVEDAAKLRAERPTQAEYEAKVPVAPEVDTSEDFAKLMEELRAAVTERPDDIEGWKLLARNEAQLGNTVDAYTAQSKIIELKGDAVTGDDYATLAAMLIQAAGGAVSAEADEALNAAMSHDPKNPIARYYAGLMHLQTDRPDQAFQFWEPLLRESAPGDPWVPIIRARIEWVAAMAGVNYELPEDPHAGVSNGPSAEDMAAAADMSTEDRQEMIRNMVEQLGQRMAEEGGPPSDWAKLIRAHGVLGNTDRAAAIWAEAQETFSDPADLAPIRDAAEQAGVAGDSDAGSGLSAATPAEVGSTGTASDETSMEAMVTSLMQRLATEGGPPDDWAMLIRSLVVTGDTERAQAIYDEAKMRFKDPNHLEPIRQAAAAAGLSE